MIDNTAGIFDLIDYAAADEPPAAWPLDAEV
jgi:hypothetical protein